MPVGDTKKDTFLVLKMDTTDVEVGMNKELELQVSLDLRLDYLVSVIKAAHLSLFYQFGYRYALHPSGRYMSAILGDFYESHCRKTPAEVREEAKKYFSKYVHMARPLSGMRSDMDGTVINGNVFLVRGSSGKFWARIVLVKTPLTTHGILVPIADNGEDFDTYQGFLTNERFNLHVNYAICNKEKHTYEIGEEATPVVWLKEGANFAVATHP